MKGRVKKRRRLLLGTLVLVALAFSWLPLREIASFLDFKFWPEAAKVRHARIFADGTGCEIVLLGTIHYGHLESETYPIWDLKRVMEYFDPAVVFVEIRQSAIDEGRWGEGPIEMPFVALVAVEQKREVVGIEYWASEFDEREDGMVANILAALRPCRKAMIATGYSHIPGIEKRLIKEGFQIQENAEKRLRSAFAQKTDEVYPSDLKREYEEIVRTVRGGGTPYSLDWAQRRHDYSKSLP